MVETLALFVTSLVPSAFTTFAIPQRDNHTCRRCGYQFDSGTKVLNENSVTYVFLQKTISTKNFLLGSLAIEFAENIWILHDRLQWHFESKSVIPNGTGIIAIAGVDAGFGEKVRGEWRKCIFRGLSVSKFSKIVFLLHIKLHLPSESSS